MNTMGKKYNTDTKTLPAECEIDYYSGTGKGGQNRNRHFNCVRIRHLPSGVTVVGTEHRSQRKNLQDALERLSERLAALNYESPARVPTRISRAAREQMREAKIHLSRKKDSRRKIPDCW